MALLTSTRNKIIALILITVIVFFGWQNGIEVFYARVVTFGSNVVLSSIKKDTSVEVEKGETTYQFKVRTLIDNRKASFPQAFGGILQPFVIVLSWQLFLFLVLNRKSALKSLLVNFGIFYLFQVIFLILLTAYHSSEFQKFLYLLLMDSFYVIALVLVIKDNMLYPVFRKR
ncbi:MAG: hypothetical protein WBJ84_01360 [Bacteroidales bacterium]